MPEVCGCGCSPGFQPKRLRLNRYQWHEQEESLPSVTSCRIRSQKRIYLPAYVGNHIYPRQLTASRLAPLHPNLTPSQRLGVSLQAGLWEGDQRSPSPAGIKCPPSKMLLPGGLCILGREEQCWIPAGGFCSSFPKETAPGTHTKPS